MACGFFVQTLYSPPNGKAPNNAALATQFEFRIENLDVADPFGL
jgi:hypothetical protein